MNESKTKQNTTPRSLPAKTRAEVEANNAEWQNRLSGSAEVLPEGNQNGIVFKGDIGGVKSKPSPKRQVPQDFDELEFLRFCFTNADEAKKREIAQSIAMQKPDLLEAFLKTYSDILRHTPSQ